MSNNIILGTAKIGIDNYGFSSKSLKSSNEDLFSCAKKNGILMLDTSPRYGDAESIIGDYHANNDFKFFISTKVDNLLKNDQSSESKIFHSVEKSIERMQVSKINTLFLHQNELEILSDSKILKALEKLKNEGLVSKIGSSIYNYQECQFTIDCDIYDVVQVPINIMDTSIYSELLKKNESFDTIIFARSIFLQGVLFNRSQIYNHIKQAKYLTKYLEKIDLLVKKYEISLIEMSCSFVLSLRRISNIIVGTNSTKNLSDIKDASLIELPEELILELRALSDQYKEWGNPKNW